jgi:hypothetical protein
VVILVHLLIVTFKCMMCFGTICESTDGMTVVKTLQTCTLNFLFFCIEACWMISPAAVVKQQQLFQQLAS